MTCSGASSDFKRLTKRENATVRGVVSAYCKVCDKPKWGPSRHTAGHNIAGYHYDPDQVLIELYTDMDVFIPELNMCEPRPWHGHYPMTPREWKISELSAWETDFAFSLAQA